ncbi:MAG: hypothetical protein U9N48_08140 [Euryarchaeota archaeon]|nr:hypothetical protein [Euryarchaeota archaeon]
MDAEKVRRSLGKTARSFRQTIPLLLGVLLLVSLVLVVVPASLYARIFTGNAILDPLIGAVVGSIAAGNPVTSYIIGGELIAQGVSILAVAAFIVAWVSVGVIQLPAEGEMLGRRFALIRFGVCFLSAVVVAILTSFTLVLI